MRHPFIVGSTYGNNLGEYTVVEISPPNMRVRYADGREQTVTIAVQARIWRRLQAPPPPVVTDSSSGSRPSRTRSDRRGAAFEGLLETDFKDNVTGTHWRSRDGLGGLVTKKLSALTGQEYTSWAVYRRPECFIYDPRLPMNSQAEGVKLPKLLIQLTPHEALYGFYIEKSDEPMDDAWYWPRFLTLLAEDRWQRDLERVMIEQGLHWLLDLVAAGPTGTYASAGQLTVPSFTPDSSFPTFAGFIDHLRSLHSDHWCNLYLVKALDKQQAIDKGTRVADHMAETLAALSPMYVELLRR